MRNIENARRVAQSHIAWEGFGETKISILDDLTSEFDVGWVFYYQSEKFLETGNPRDSIVGNAPLFVPRADLAPSYVSYHRPIDESMAAFKLCGDANGERIPSILISRQEVDASAHGAIRAIRNRSHWGLADTKLAVDECLAGNESVVATRSIRDADELLRELKPLGFRGVAMYQARVANDRIDMAGPPVIASIA